MALLLLQLHKITQKQFERRIRQLYMTHQVEGPQAIAWGLRTMGEICPPGKDRMFYLTEADKASEDAVRMKKLMNGWSVWGEHPWWIVHGKPEKQMARYNSDSMLIVKDGTLEEYFGGRLCRCSAKPIPSPTTMVSKKHV